MLPLSLVAGPQKISKKIQVSSQIFLDFFKKLKIWRNKKKNILTLYRSKTDLTILEKNNIKQIFFQI